MSYRHVVFDLDGTLIDSRQDIADAANAMLETYGASPLPVPAVVSMVGEGARLLVERVVSRAGLDVEPDEALARFVDAYDARLANHTRPYEGVETMLADLTSAGIAVTVLTNKPHRATGAVLDAFGLRRYVREFVGGDTPHGRKPAPAGLLHLAAATGSSPAETLMVGDTWVDVDTAIAAGVDACLVSYGFGFVDVPEATRARARFVVDAPGGVTTLAHPPAPSTPHPTRG